MHAEHKAAAKDRHQEHKLLLQLSCQVPWPPRKAGLHNLFHPQGARCPLYLLHNLSILHVKLDDVHMAEGNDAKGPHHPGAIGIHHLVEDAVTMGEKRGQGHQLSP